MNAAVVGGTGVVGSRVVAALVARGDAVTVISRSAPAPGAAIPGVGHRRADLMTGDGLAAALDGVDVVVNAVSDPAGRSEVLVEGTRRLLAAEAQAGVGHHVAISIVGCDASELRYHRVTRAQEQVVVDGPVPWTVLRATQFHTLVDMVLSTLAKKRLLPRGSGLLQPIDPGVVARRLADAAHGEPSGRLPDIAGPEVLTVSQLAQIWRTRTRRGPFIPLPVPGVGAVGRPLRRGVLTAPAAAVEGPTFGEWLAGKTAAVRESSAR
jgi:uncharacterized protein YbjT (DUF2867 family)